MNRPPPLCKPIVETIGDTPMIDLSNMVQTRGLLGRLLAREASVSVGFSTGANLEAAFGLLANGLAMPTKTI